MRYEVASRSYSAPEVPTQQRRGQQPVPPPAHWDAPEFLPPDISEFEGKTRALVRELSSVHGARGLEHKSVPPPRADVLRPGPKTEPSSGVSVGSISASPLPATPRRGTESSSGPLETPSAYATPPGGVKKPRSQGSAPHPMPRPEPAPAPKVVVQPQAVVTPQIPPGMEAAAEQLAKQIEEQLARTPGAPKLTPEQIRQFVAQQLAQRQIQAQQPQPQPAQQPLPQAKVTSASKLSKPSKSKSRSKSKSKSKRSAPSIQIPQSGGAIDPWTVPLPPELAPTIFGWVRRLALQADLTSADRLLRDALGELTNSLSVLVVYPGADGLFSLGTDDEMPRDASPLVAVAQSRQAAIASHTALVPITTTTETVGVIILGRNPRQPGFAPVEQIAMLTLARESAAVLHHLAVQHIQRQSEIEADKGSLYRGEALEAHRTRGHEGVLVNLSPGWVKKAYPILVITLLVGIVLGIILRVPTYSSGKGLVIYPGTTVVAPDAGNVAQLNVKPQDHVTKGQILLTLASPHENAAYEQAKADRDNMLEQHLFDPTDEQVKKQLASAENALKLAKAKVDARVIRAPKDGTVEDIRLTENKAVQPGQAIMTIIDEGRTPEVLAFLPCKDRPKLKLGMNLQTGIDGYQKTRETAKISEVHSECVGGNEAVNFVGNSLGDSLKGLLESGGTYVIVKAKLESNKFKTERSTLFFHQGMTATTEVKLNSKPFLATLLPTAITKYLPD